MEILKLIESLKNDIQDSKVRVQGIKEKFLQEAMTLTHIKEANVLMAYTIGMINVELKYQENVTRLLDDAYILRKNMELSKTA